MLSVSAASHFVPHPTCSAVGSSSPAASQVSGMTPIKCAVEAIESCSATKAGSKLSESAKNSASVAWFVLGNTLAREYCQFPTKKILTATVNKRSYTKEECYQQAIVLNPKEGNSWFNTALYLPKNTVFTFNSRPYSKVACYIQAFDLRKSSASAFTLEELHDRHLLNLGFALASGNEKEVSSFESKHVTKQACFLEVLKRNPHLARAWYGLGTCRRTAQFGNHNYNPQACFQKALELDPKLAEAWCCLARTLTKNGKILVGGKEFSKGECYEEAFLNGISHDSLDAAMWLDFASTLSPSALVNWNNPFSRKDCYVESLKKDPENAKVWYELGLTLHSKETVVIGEEACNAQKCFVNAVLRNQDDPIAWEGLAKTLSGTKKAMLWNKPYSRKACLIEALSKDSKTAWHYLAEELPKGTQAKIKNHSYDRGDCCIKALEINAKNVGAWKLLAKILEEETHTEAAAISLVRTVMINKKECTPLICHCEVLRLDAKEPKAWHYIGVFLEPQETVNIGGKPYTRQQCCVKALELDPTLHKMWHNIGASLKPNETIQVGNQTYTRLECYANELKQNPDYASAWNDAGVVLEGEEVLCIEEESFTKQQCFVKAIKKDPGFILAWNNLGTTVIGGREIEIGGTTYNRRKCALQVLQLNPNYALGWYNLGNALQEEESFASKDPSQYTPKTCWVKTVELDPKLGEAWANLGTILRNETVIVAGKYYTRVQCCQEAAQIYPNDPKVWKNLALALKEGETVTISNKPYDTEKCYLKARDLEMLFSS